MNRFPRTLTLLPAALVAVLLLSGCSLIAGEKGPLRNRGNDYLDAEPATPLQWPAGLAAPAQQELYPVPALEQRRRRADGPVEIPEPPQRVELEEAPVADEAASAGEGVELTGDGNGFPVLMISLSFDWAWQRIGDALKTLPDIEIEDLDRELAIYFLRIDGERAESGDPFQLKLNYTANGIQVALQDGEDAMASRDVAENFMQQLHKALH